MGPGRLDLPKPAGSVRLTLHDIFDRPTERIIPVKAGPVQKAEDTPSLRPGLDYRSFEGDWQSLPNLTPLTPAKQGRVNAISESATQGRTKSCAFSTKTKNLLVVGTSSTKTAAGKLIVSEHGGKHFQVVAEKNDWKVANVAFEAIAEGEHYIYFATSSGVYYCYNLGMYLYQYRHILTPNVPYTAIISWTIPKGGRNRILTTPANARGAVYSGRIGYYWSVEWNRQDVTSGAVPDGVTSLACAAKDGERVYATAVNGLFVSRDQGRSFEQLQKK